MFRGTYTRRHYTMTVVRRYVSLKLSSDHHGEFFTISLELVRLSGERQHAMRVIIIGNNNLTTDTRRLLLGLFQVDKTNNETELIL